MEQFSMIPLQYPPLARIIKTTPIMDISLPFTNFTDIYESMLFSDIFLQSSSGKRYPAHKLILAMFSDFFKVLFSKEFKDPGMIIELKVDDTTMKLYLDLIYKRKIQINTTWKDAIALLKFLDFTQTLVPNLEKILNSIYVKQAQEYPEFLNNVIELYHGNIPLEFIQSMCDIPIRMLNYKDLGEDFTRELIISTHDDDDKYDIAHKAVADGLNPSIYNLVQYEALQENIDPKAKHYLKHIDDNLLTENIQRAVYEYISFRAAIISVGIFDSKENSYIFNVRGKIKDQEITCTILAKIKHNGDDEYDTIFDYHDKSMSVSKLEIGTIIEINGYRKAYAGYKIFLHDFDILEY